MDIKDVRVRGKSESAKVYKEAVRILKNSHHPHNQKRRDALYAIGIISEDQRVIKSDSYDRYNVV